jgi:predicted RNase H-like HicB family nuclease
MADYIALIHKEADSDYGVSFPDFPGVVTAGRTLDEARTMATEALAFHIRGLVEDGEAIPPPSTLDEVMADPMNRDGVVMLVPAAAIPKTVRVNVTMPEDALARFDRFARDHGFTRSGFLVRSAERAIDEDRENVEQRPSL